ncbi:PREDICTED: cysteine-rich venom protein-like [Gavialis gangeticus]|uniref:cysteine-rich venom protein-like n=1 Tax=Gavialis gangeticus TaxID=94835 RepID=UPI00092FD970|nr:PREDICTED: cysteine-rich venom protein-like [Gavialis gangeticus]
MLLLATFLCLTAVLQQSSGQKPAKGYNDLATDKIDQQNVIVVKHNTLRAQVIPPASNMLRMEWSDAAQANAKRWADLCTLSHSPQSYRTTVTVCGENLYMSSAPTAWSDVIQAWYNEKKDFKYGSGPTRPEAVIAHYTQVVWYKSYQIGCAVAFCPQNIFSYFYVCHYCPAGNLKPLINTPYKSGPPCGDCPNACDNGLCTNPCKYEDKYLNCPELAKLPGCNKDIVKDNCRASCQCTTEIK